MPYNLTTLENGCRELGIELSQKQKNQFIQFYEFLVEKNKVMNLTGITEFEEVLTKHFLDSLACVKAIDMTKVKTIMDIGTGAGFPGVPLKIAFPHLEACLLDSLKKRVNFLEESFELLGLEGIKAIHGRAEEYAKNKEYREKYDLCGVQNALPTGSFGIGFSTFLQSTSLMIRRKRSPRSIRDVAIAGPVFEVNTSLAGSSLSPIDNGFTLMEIGPSAMVGHTSNICASRIPSFPGTRLYV